MLDRPDTERDVPPDEECGACWFVNKHCLKKEGAIYFIVMEKEIRRVEVLVLIGFGLYGCSAVSEEKAREEMKEK